MNPIEASLQSQTLLGQALLKPGGWELPVLGIGAVVLLFVTLLAFNFGWIYLRVNAVA